MSIHSCNSEVRLNSDAGLAAGYQCHAGSTRSSSHRACRHTTPHLLLAAILITGLAVALRLPAQQLQAPGNRAAVVLSNGMEVINAPITKGPVEPTWESLGDHFKTPSWWNEAKIGVWLHWGPQSVGEDGDWYAKWIYMPKYAWSGYSRVYQDHLERFGHPSVAGYKDILPLWHAEKWDPEALMA